MGELQRVTPIDFTGALPRRDFAWTVDIQELAVFAAATVLVWAHTIDELRIGEVVAVPFGIANLAVVAGWPRLRRLRAVAAVGFGLFWALAVIPYHLLPLLEGAVTGQNVSGLSRLVGGAAMIAVGVAIWRREQRHSQRSLP